MKMKTTTQTRGVAAIAKSPLAVLAALTPRMQDVALTVMLKQNNASVCKDILLGKLLGWETSLDEYQRKSPDVLADAIAELIEQVRAARFALGLPTKDAVPPAIAYVSVAHLSTMLEVASCQMRQEWVPSALSSTKAANGGGIGAWIKRAAAPVVRQSQHQTRSRPCA
ncbi:hypothetical protein [Rhodoferax ferrireducens]|nr:hypothetical protein [Rhodoferax ferrireducens]